MTKLTIKELRKAIKQLEKTQYCEKHPKVKYEIWMMPTSVCPLCKKIEYEKFYGKVEK